MSRKTKGVTLVELLVALVILSIIITIALSVLFNAQRTQRMIDNKYDCRAEADRVAKEIENSLRLAQKLISGTDKRVKFLDINNDTNEFYLRNDTLFNNQKTITNLSVDSLFFTYTKIKEDEKITDLYWFDENRDGILDTLELSGVSGINVFVDFLCPQAQASKRIKIKKQLAVLLRNLQVK